MEKDQKLSIENSRNCVGNHTAKQKSCPAFCKKCFHCGKAQLFEKFAILNIVVGIQILEIVDGLPGVLSLSSIHNGLSDKISICLL